ncbi:transmembrane channel-like protein 4 isoform X1 [Tachyglossus aculeatus]|uniref:transmembrane channel-like protein 4 isoform X1 n=1 Tax=Tachyglossus aculeatus TaxID=9261 RepID=UPI0018F481F3|nr:transmembrane channel-like protein 4 isoform X1 [Tachyglossus aculeatus]
MEEESGRGGEARAVSWEPVARGPRPGQSLSTLLSQLPSVASVRYRGPVPGGPREEEWEAGGWAGGLVEEAPALQNPRELPWPMEAKRMFWRRLKAEQAGGQAPAGGQRGGWGLHQFRKAQVWTTDILQGVQPWRGDLLKIGGHFGSGTQAYFSLLRFLLLLNVLGALLPVTLVTLPTLLLGTGGGSQGSPSPSPPSPNSSLCGPYNPLPTGLVSYTEQLFNLLSGQGYLEWSVLFYGFYPKTDPGGYRLPLAYLLSAAGAGLLCLLLILHRSVGGLRQTLLAESGVLIRYSDRVFCGWDFCLADPKAVRLRHNTVRFEIQVELEEETVRQREAARTLTKRMGVWGVRALLNLLVLGLLGAAFYGVYWATQMSIQLQKDPQVSGDSFLKLLVDFLPSIFISAANLVLPPVLAGLTRLEGYTLSRQVLFILLRTVFLRIASLLVLLLTLWAKITCNGDPHAPSCKGCGYNSPELPCWETLVGQEMYKLLLFDLLTVLAVVLLVQFPRKLLCGRCPGALGRLAGTLEFQVPAEVLGLVYAQTVVWIGSFFSPLLPLINTAKFVLLFYLKKVALFSVCSPASRTFRGSSAHFFFPLVMLLGLGLSAVPVLYGVFVIQPSEVCGPFRNQTRIWDVVPRAIEELPPTARNLFFFLGTQAFAVPLFLLASLLMFYTMALSSSYNRLVHKLQKQIELESQNKRLLVQQTVELG